MHIVAINVSPPVEVEDDGRTVRTGIFKVPVSGPVRVGALNLAGDAQADPAVHGGVHKAVYAYSLDHYAFWQQQLGMVSMPYGQFGENLTVAGLDEELSCVGDHLAIGTARFAITQGRQPCFKLGIRFGNPQMPRLFTQAGRSGFYLKVLEEGVITAGDAVHVVHADPARVPVKALFQAYMAPGSAAAREVLQRALAVADLSESWRGGIAKRLGEQRLRE
jgi:MOSC domain-containing protein YiiM